MNDTVIATAPEGMRWSPLHNKYVPIPKELTPKIAQSVYNQDTIVVQELSYVKIGIWVFIGIPLILVVWAFIGGVFSGIFGTKINKALDSRVNKEMQHIYTQVADDAVKQYGIAKRSGTKIDACVHAGMVAAAFIQAKNEMQYQEWKAIEKEDCDSAGLPK